MQAPGSMSPPGCHDRAIAHSGARRYQQIPPQRLFRPVWRNSRSGLTRPVRASP
jgi:hypothetical protein